jgi:glycosyltransferase involved in cell wall biosynthesis
MKEKLNILFLASWYPSRVNPFNGNFVQRHARSVAQYADVTVLHTCSDPSCKGGYEISRLKNGPIEEVIVYYKKVNHNIPLISHLQKYLRSRKALKIGLGLIMKQARPDLVHLNVTFPAGLFSLHIKKKFNIPYILTEHWTIFLDSDPSAFPRGARNAIMKILRNASVICPVSHDLKQAMKKISPDNVYRVVNNVVDTEVFSVAEKKNEGKIILHVSTLNDHQKNISGILRATKELSRKRSDFKILIVGDGDIEPHQVYARELGVGDEMIEFKGKQPIEKIAEIMQGSDIFLLFSNYENLPCVIIEAHASGLPVLSTDVGGISEMINDQNGVLIAKGDEKSLVGELDAMLDRMDTYDRKKIREEAVGKYSYTVIGKQFIEIYKDVIDKEGAQ